MVTPLTQPAPTRGRPVEINREHLAMVALRLFESRGFDTVSAAEIATAAGVSRRSLFRYFPTKADLVWDKFDDSLEILEFALLTEQANPLNSPLEAAVAALGTVADHTQVVSLTRTRLKLIANNADLFAYGSHLLQAQAAILRTYLTQSGMDQLHASVSASALTLASLNGYIHWATTDSEDDPAVIVRKALASLSNF